MNGVAINKNITNFKTYCNSCSLFFYGSNYTKKALSPRKTNELKWVQKNENFAHM